MLESNDVDVNVDVDDEAAELGGSGEGVRVAGEAVFELISRARSRETVITTWSRRGVRMTRDA